MKSRSYLFSILTLTILVFVFNSQVSTKKRNCEFLIASDTVNSFKSNTMGIAFHLEAEENIKSVNKNKVILYHQKEPKLLIEVHNRQDSSFAAKGKQKKDFARFMAESITKKSFDRPEAVDHSCRIDSVKEFKSQNNLRILVFYRTEVSEGWGKESRINATWESCPEYFIDLIQTTGAVVEFRWMSKDSLAVPRINRLVETVTTL